MSVSHHSVFKDVPCKFLHGHSKSFHFFVFNLKESRLSDCFSSTVIKSHISDLKSIAIQYRGMQNALDVFQKYRFCEDYTNLFRTEMFLLEFLKTNIGEF